MKKTKTIIAVSVLFAVSMLCFVLGVLLLPKQEVSATDATILPSAPIEEKYSLGTAFVIPEGEIAYNGQNYTADAYSLQMPDGSVQEGRNHVLDMAGQYIVIYEVNTGELQLTAEQAFLVTQQMFAVSNAASSVTYAETLDRYYQATSGLNVDLALNDTFTFSEPIDLNETPDFLNFDPYERVWSDLSVPAYNRPNGGYMYVIDAYKYILRLTDCYDSSNYIEIIIDLIDSNTNGTPYSYQTYMRARMAGEESVGMNAGTSYGDAQITIGSTVYDVYYDRHGAQGVRANQPSYFYPYLFKYDIATNQILFNCTGTNTWSLINDLDNGDVNRGNLFGGFTTGEVYLSIYTEECTGTSVDFQVAQIGKYEQTALEMENEYIDTQEPEIYIDTVLDTSQEIYAAKGEALTVLSAHAQDINLVGGVTTRMFYGYDSAQPVEIPINNGQVIPENTGVYTIEYTATDTYGNPALETVSITVRDDITNAVTITTEQAAELVAGLECVLPEFTITSINGETVETEIFAVFEGDEENMIPIDFETRSFLVEYVGEYEIRFVCRGALTETVYSYDIVSISEGVIRIDTSNAYLPKYFINNATYTLEPVTTYKYDAKFPELVDCSYYVIEDGAAERSIDYSEYTVQANSTVQFKYVYEDTSVLSEEISVVDVGFGSSLNMENYFVGEAEKEIRASSILLTANSQNTEALVDFVNIQSINAFSVSFRIPDGADNYEAFCISMTDVYDANNVCVLRFTSSSAGSMMLSVNGSEPMDLGVSFVSTRYLSVSYQHSTDRFEVVGSGSVACPVDFTSDKVFLAFSFEGISGNAGVEINSIGSQRINQGTSDTVSPTIVYDDTERGERKFGTVITIPVASVNDTLSPYLQKNFTISLISPGGYATAEDGTLLNGAPGNREYQVALEEYGNYRVEISYSDQSGNTATESYAIYVSDRTSPVITIANDYNAQTLLSASRGQQITLADYSVTDNFGEQGLRSWVLVITPFNEMIITDGGETIELNRLGRWKICYYSIDSAGNGAMRYYQIEVKES